MEEEVDYEDHISDLKLIIEKLPQLVSAHGVSFATYLPIEHYENSNAGLSKLAEDFKHIDFDHLINDDLLKKNIASKKKQIGKLESRISTLNDLIGKQGDSVEGSSFHSFVSIISKEIEELRKTRDELDIEINSKNIELESKISSINTTVKTANEKALQAIKVAENIAKQDINLAEQDAKQKIGSAEQDAKSKVRLINQFKDFIEETNNNMKLYTAVIVLVVVAIGLTIAISIPNLLKSFDNYNAYVLALDAKAGSMPIINYAFGILVLKLPWALCLSAVFTGGYALIKGLLITYEKINQDKRNMSAIYSVSGNIAQALNEYGLAIVKDYEDPDTNEINIHISESKVNIEHKRETLKWNQIINYFERMQSNTIEKKEEDDPSKIKFVTGVLNKVLAKIPTPK
jgi:rRNA maturation endonuclease Nob1